MDSSLSYGGVFFRCLAWLRLCVCIFTRTSDGALQFPKAKLLRRPNGGRRMIYLQCIRFYQGGSGAKGEGADSLIHCVQGVSRSCALSIAWLMLTAGIDYNEAYVQVRQGRLICAPNTGFICSLLEWQRLREQPISSPFLHRTGWHVPRFPNDLLLKLCLHEEDRKHVTPTLEALDSRDCFLLVAPRTSCATGFTPTGSKREPEAPANGV
ncbi:unnamed protein product, partial [Ascophyllum nodosum]